MRVSIRNTSLASPDHQLRLKGHPRSDWLIRTRTRSFLAISDFVLPLITWHNVLAVHHKSTITYSDQFVPCLVRHGCMDRGDRGGFMRHIFMLEAGGWRGARLSHRTILAFIAAPG